MGGHAVTFRAWPSARPSRVGMTWWAVANQWTFRFTFVVYALGFLGLPARLLLLAGATPAFVLWCRGAVERDPDLRIPLWVLLAVTLPSASVMNPTPEVVNVLPRVLGVAVWVSLALAAIPRTRHRDVITDALGIWAVANVILWVVGWEGAARFSPIIDLSVEPGWLWFEQRVVFPLSGGGTNLTGYAAGVVLVIALLSLRVRQGPGRTTMLVLYGLASLIVVVAVAGRLAATVTVLGLGAGVFWRLLRSRRWLLTAVGLALALPLVWLGVFGPVDSQPDELFDLSLSGRTVVWSAGLDHLDEVPAFGLGPAGHARTGALAEFGGRFDAKYHHEFVPSLHNSALQSYYNAGVLGFVTLMAGWFMVIWKDQDAWVGAGLVILLVSAAFETTFVALAATPALMVWILLASVASVAWKSRARTDVVFDPPEVSCDPALRP